MNARYNESTLIILLITLCLYLPLIDSWHSGYLWGLNWQSPTLMFQLSMLLRPVKLALVILALTLLITKSNEIEQTFENTIVRYAFIASSGVVAAVQILFLSLGVWLGTSKVTNPDYYHLEKTFENYSIYVRTADPGAMGSAYHYFYLQCALDYNRYQLKLIEKLDWMRAYDFEVEEGVLLIQSNNGNTKKFNLSNFSCDS